MTSKWAPHALGLALRNVAQAAPPEHRVVLVYGPDERAVALVFEGLRPVLWFGADDPVTALEGLENRLLSAIVEAIP